jgi:hypothetical protein
VPTRRATGASTTPARPWPTAPTTSAPRRAMRQETPARHRPT